MGILKVNDMIPDFANFYTFKDRPRAMVFSKVPATVGRGPVPRRAAITVGRGPVPRHAAILTENVCHLCLPGVFCHVWKIAGDRPPRYEKKRSFLSPMKNRGGQAPALRKKEAFSFNVNNFSLDKNRKNNKIYPLMTTFY